MNKQISLSGLMDELSQARTKKKEILEQMDRLIPWGKWEEEIRACYYKGERGNKPYGIELMLRLYVLQNLYTLSDEGTVAEVIDSRAFSDFCGVESSNQVPNGDTLGRFRNLLIRNGIQEKLFAQVAGLLQERGLLLKKGTIVDSTLISAPTSTKNREKKRDTEAPFHEEGEHLALWLQSACWCGQGHRTGAHLESHRRKCPRCNDDGGTGERRGRHCPRRQRIPWGRKAGRGHSTEQERQKDPVQNQPPSFTSKELVHPFQGSGEAP